MEPARHAGDRVVTPEAVALDLQTATVATRGLAQLLDVVLQGIAALLVTVAAGLADLDAAGGTVFFVVVLVAVFLIRIVYPLAMETRFGATLGHMAMGLRVVTLDGTPIRARQAVARVAVGLFEIDATFGALALLTAATRRDGRRLGDLAAGTQVVSVRVGTGQASTLDVAVPPHLRGWAASLDTSGLHRPERTALRRYLLRAAELAPGQRDALAASLADKLLPRMAARRPDGATAHDALTAIAGALGERGDRPTQPPLSDLPPPTTGGSFEPPR